MLSNGTIGSSMGGGKRLYVYTDIESVSSKTIELLNRLSDAGYRNVAISFISSRVKSSVGYNPAFGEQLFVAESVKLDGSHWPAFWEIKSDLGIGQGGASSLMAQVKPDILTAGAYYFDGVQWLMEV